MNGNRAIDVDTAQMRRLRHALTNDLSSQGYIRTVSWRETFEYVPRHMFVPRYFLDRERNGCHESIDGSNPEQHNEWLTAIYSDEPLITQLEGTDDTWAPEGRASSSSTTPGLMALMLEALDIRDDMTILEIGTGTGYNAALLCHRLGADHVTSVDIDPALVNTARQRLLTLGYAPTVKAYDGNLGYPPNAPYDRIIATVSLPSIPSAWIEQTRQNGLILANLYRELGGGALALLIVHDDRAEGNFLLDYGGFMPVRSQNPPETLALLNGARGKHGNSRPAILDGHALDDPAFGFLAALRMSAQRIEVQPETGPGQFWLVSRDGSWAYQTTDPTGRLVATQGGQRRLWDELETIHAEWTALGQPPRNDFGLTVIRDGRHLLWHSRPGSASWDLTSLHAT